MDSAEVEIVLIDDGGFMCSRGHQLQRAQKQTEMQNVDECASASTPMQCVSFVSENELEPRRHSSLNKMDLRRRQRTALLTSAAALLICSSAVLPNATASQSTSAFVFPPNLSSTSSDNSMSILSRKSPMRRTNFATNFPPNTTSRRGDTWSNAVRQKSGLNESRFGVRRRVKSVLDKAKKRTGIDNSSVEKNDEPYMQSGPNIVAEAASIGGWGTVVLDEEGYVDEDLDIGLDRGDSVYDDAVVASDFTAGDDSYSDRNGAIEYSPTSVPIADDDVLEDDTILSSVNAKSKYSSDAMSGLDSNGKDNVTEKDLPLIPGEALPFTLPKLSTDQNARVMRGERVQFQDDMGRAGSGFVVWDVKAPASVVWDCLLDFQSYPQTIPTVREVVMYTNTHLKEDYRAEKPLDFEDGTAAICKHGIPSVTRAQFSLSKFRLKIAAVHKYRPHPEGDYMIFTLDPASRNMVLKYAKGIWHTQGNPDGKEGYTRVWLLCELSVSRLLPQWIVDYAAARAMPRATTWLKPQVEAAATLWLKDSNKD
ncbi:hypothetical protein ACHAWO_008256 [Cyclotella atomus]|uniref:START domain-containing protein n=1 Tax=Cyclotella atomus TaxID=382360 RepID=A0ABD3MWE4_9STRA